ncbi:hypothetical protein J2Y66_003663 [Paenarthrobacter nitroguajacolicus]|uniref:hypothetical protein n=1 Tax=Paenarthrobacter nitroguajacolicus TaxID=211146 RepID=UPI0028556483|nr:hypothetical protein [Paenarthrobacter nitroguajacolicus]MDR6989148.1 hypothetical protein [Paenarthrobacter nitroguajacolicus]
MNSYYPLALLVARQEAAQSAFDAATSALSNAPGIPVAENFSLSWMNFLRGRLATLLHRVAWALEADRRSDSGR